MSTHTIIKWQTLSVQLYFCVPKKNVVTQAKTSARIPQSNIWSDCENQAREGWLYSHLKSNQIKLQLSTEQRNKQELLFVRSKWTTCGTKQKDEPEDVENQTPVAHRRVDDFHRELFVSCIHSFIHITCFPNMNPSFTQWGAANVAFTACRRLLLRTCQPASWNVDPTRWGSHSPDRRCWRSWERRGSPRQNRLLRSQTPTGSRKGAPLGHRQLLSGSVRGASFNIEKSHEQYTLENRDIMPSFSGKKSSTGE